MEIAPHGDIYLLKDVPLDNTYQHSVYWPPKNEGGLTRQRDWFLGSNNSGTNFVKRRFNHQTYTRLNRGTIRVEVLADDIYDCNYLVYQNIDFGDEKLFFAFITKIEYINNSVSEITFEIDIVQTWYFDFTLMPCFLERTHTRTDDVGDNIEPEPFDLQEYVYEGEISKIQNTDDMYIVICTVDVSSTAVVSGKVYGRVYGAATLKAFRTDDVSGIDTELASWVTSGKSDAVINIYMIPAFLITGTIELGGTLLTQNMIRSTPYTVSFSNVNPNNALVKNFHPHNKKLYTYPYTMLEVFTPKGDTLTVRYEFFVTQPKFSIGGSVTPPVEMFCAPFEYKNFIPTGSSLIPQPLMSEAITLANYPQCSWNADAYKAWMAQNAIPLAVGAITNVGGLIASSATGNIVGAAEFGGNIVGSVGTFIAGVIQKKTRTADAVHGSVNGTSSVAMNMQSFYIARKAINESDARAIDAYLDMFGYTIRRLQEPKRKNRRYFTYIKTNGCVIDSSMPADDANRICKIHDNGITYWDVSEIPLIVNNYQYASLNDPLE